MKPAHPINLDTTKMVVETAPEALAKLQTRFAAHIRDPEGQAAPDGIEDRRMAIYRELFFNNICNFLSSNFPVLKSLYDESSWTTLCRDFFRDFRCHTPLFPELPREFLKYLQDHRQELKDDPPFMLELAHYEWVELALTLDESETDDLVSNPHGDILNDCPVLSPLAWPLSYKYPVHQIRSDFQPKSAPEKPTHLLVWRKHDFSINFMQLNDFSLLLVQKLKEEPKSPGLQLLKDIATSTKHPNPDMVVSGGEALLKDLLDKQIILGTR